MTDDINPFTGKPRKRWPPPGARKFPYSTCQVCGTNALPYDDLCKLCWANLNGQKPPKRLTKFFEDPPPRYDQERGAP